MPVKRIVVPGSGGMLGYAMSEYFRRQGYRVDSLTRGTFDISRDGVEKLAPLLEGADAVINCAGIIRQRMDGHTIEEVLQVNSIFPVNLAMLCGKLNVKCFHVTTDCVYSGARGQYTESDYFDARDVYGMSKNAGDTSLCMTLRTSIIGEEKGNFKSLLAWVKSQRGKTVDGYADHLWNGVTTVYLAEIIKKILDLSLYEPGIFHVHSRETLSKYELVQLINEVYGLDITVNKFSTGIPCDRSLRSEKPLSSMLVDKTLATQIRELKQFFSGASELDENTGSTGVGLA